MKSFFKKIKDTIKKYEDELYSEDIYVEDEEGSFNEDDSNIITKEELDNISDDELNEENYDNDEETENDINTNDNIEELKVDVYQTQNEVVVIAFIPGVTPSSIDIEISKDILTIQGTRAMPAAYENADFFIQELFWGNFERTIMLPTEIDIDSSVANEHRGILTITMPKLNKTRKAKIKVKSR